MFSTVGDPREVLRLEEIKEPKPARDEVLLQMLFSPVNPSDLHSVPRDAKVLQMARMVGQRFKIRPGALVTTLYAVTASINDDGH